ncbi:MAG: hypothetical protein GY868_17470, partial [Deltaproteobacteria bacterium]|nr:hypothetical protein [Deltaproteobacteria bacterium]
IAGHQEQGRLIEEIQDDNAQLVRSFKKKQALGRKGPVRGLQLDPGQAAQALHGRAVVCNLCEISGRVMNGGQGPDVVHNGRASAAEKENAEYQDREAGTAERRQLIADSYFSFLSHYQ